jgi:orotate phosphoribosyltransferase
MSAEGQFLVGKLGWQLLRERAPEATHVGGLTMGADPVAYAIAHRGWLEGRPLDAFSVRKQAKEHGLGQRIEGGLPEHARCIVVEDSMTTGGSAREAIAAVRAHGASVVGVLTVVDREEGAAAAIDVPILALFTGRELLAAAQAPR